MALRIVSTVLLLAIGLIIRPAFSQSPTTGGLCYALTGNTVETTVIGGGDSYPIEVRADVRDVPGGVEVVHRAVFVRVPLRVFVPWVGNE